MNVKLKVNMDLDIGPIYLISREKFTLDTVSLDVFVSFLDFS